MATVRKTVLSFVINRKQKKTGSLDHINCLVLQIKFYWKKATLMMQGSAKSKILTLSYLRKFAGF